MFLNTKKLCPRLYTSTKPFLKARPLQSGHHFNNFYNLGSTVADHLELALIPSIPFLIYRWLLILCPKVLASFNKL